jgi:DNA-binding NtrC family response regulator
MRGYSLRVRVGLELYRREHPDVVVLGPNMPEMDGITVLEEVRKINPDQPVIIFPGGGIAERKRWHMGTLKHLLEAPLPTTATQCV